MNRNDVDQWLAEHPDTIHVETSERPGDLLKECEERVRTYAHRDAWVHARQVAEEALRRFEGSFGLPASEPFVTREVCHEIARELRRHEPHPDNIEGDEWIRHVLVDKLDPEARDMLRQWLSEFAEKEEHAVWKEIVYFTDHLARTLIKQGQMNEALTWDFERSYSRVAARVSRMLIQEFEAHTLDPMAPPVPMADVTKTH